MWRHAISAYFGYPALILRSTSTTLSMRTQRLESMCNNVKQTNHHWLYSLAVLNSKRTMGKPGTSAIAVQTTIDKSCQKFFILLTSILSQLAAFQQRRLSYPDVKSMSNLEFGFVQSGDASLTDNILLIVPKCLMDCHGLVMTSLLGRYIKSYIVYIYI